MLSLDDCNRMELKRLARWSTPAQIAEAKARIAAEAAARENAERQRAAAESVAAARRVRRHFEAHGADEIYRRLFGEALIAARRSQHAQSRWLRYQATAARLGRLASGARAQENCVRREDR